LKAELTSPTWEKARGSPDQAPPGRVVLFGRQPHVVAQVNKPLE